LISRLDRFNTSIKKLPKFDRLLNRCSLRRLNQIRSYFSCKYLSGKGIEIGAQINPLPVNKERAVVLYVDRISAEENSTLNAMPLDKFVPVSILSEAETLNSVHNSSVDFVIANHVLEHIPDPVSALIEWMRVLKDDGVMYLSVPNRFCNEYDFERPETTIGHLKADYERNDFNKKEEHWKEFITIVEGLSKEDPLFEERLQNHYRRLDDRIHMHVYDARIMEQIFTFLKQEVGLPFHVEDCFYFKYSFELIYIIRKTNKKVSEIIPYSMNRHFLRNIFIAVLLNMRGITA
jgi:ubiquinone/menaquinone biosynthesis C-methylase UbiE